MTFIRIIAFSTWRIAIIRSSLNFEFDLSCLWTLDSWTHGLLDCWTLDYRHYHWTQDFQALGLLDSMTLDSGRNHRTLDYWTLGRFDHLTLDSG